MPEGWMPLGGAGPHPPAGRRLTVAVYETATARGATVIIPPAKPANISGHGPRSPARDRMVTLVKQLGRRRWKKVSGYHRQGRVENTCFRDTSIIGDGLRARSPAGQGSEAVLGCEILNTDDRPRPTRVISNRPVRILSVGLVRARDDSCNNACAGKARSRGTRSRRCCADAGEAYATSNRRARHLPMRYETGLPSSVIRFRT